MTQKAAICKALLEGHTLSIMNGFKWFSCTNIPREIGRSVEREFDVKVKRTPKEGTSKYGQVCNWMEYRLEITDYNIPGIAKMRDYVNSQMKTINPKTDNEKRSLKQGLLIP
jgi:hypothetical protein